MSLDYRSRLRKTCLEKVIAYIQEMCCLLSTDKESKGEFVPNDENLIRNILLEEYINHGQRMKNFLFLPEIYTNYTGHGHYKGRTDIYVKFETDFQEKEAYFIAECKRLDGLTTLNKKYVKEGIRRFVANPPKYSSFYGTSMMIGFIVKPIDMQANAKRIEVIQNQATDQTMHGNWIYKDKTGKTERFECVYRNRKPPITLQHLFADFSKIV